MAAVIPQVSRKAAKNAKSEMNAQYQLHQTLSAPAGAVEAGPDIGEEPVRRLAQVVLRIDAVNSDVQGALWQAVSLTIRGPVSVVETVADWVCSTSPPARGFV